jgi:curved DNA-binding protein CbpA
MIMFVGSGNTMDYYVVLEVKRDASDADIKSAYRRLATRYHPQKVAPAEKVVLFVNCTDSPPTT